LECSGVSSEFRPEFRPDFRSEFRPDFRSEFSSVECRFPWSGVLDVGLNTFYSKRTHSIVREHIL